MAKRTMTRPGSAGAGTVSFNMTPMIDCTFQLIIFFVLTSQAASQDIVKLTLPNPFESPARGQEVWEVPHKIVVNVRSMENQDNAGDPLVAGRALEYVVSGEPIALTNLDRLETLIKGRKEEALAGGVKKEDFFIEIRGDKRVQYREVFPVLELAARLGVAKMNIAALVKTTKIAQE